MSNELMSLEGSLDSPERRMNPAHPDVLTAREVAMNLRCSKAQVYRLIKGEVDGIPPLPSIALGRRRVVRRSSLERWKSDNESGQTSATMPMNQKRKP